MTRKPRQVYTSDQKREYAKLMVNEGYSNKAISEMSGACSSAVTRWKKQYQEELSGVTPEGLKALTPEHQTQRHWRCQRDLYHHVLEDVNDLEDFDAGGAQVSAGCGAFSGND